MDQNSLGAVESDRQAKALADHSAGSPTQITWPTAPMGARIDLEDEDALRVVLDGR